MILSIIEKRFPFVKKPANTNSAILFCYFTRGVGKIFFLFDFFFLLCYNKIEKEGFMKKYDIAIVGGGASGLLLSCLLAERGKKNFILLERNDRLGKKLSATGNGQGNITNLDMSAEHFYSDEREKVSSLLSRFSQRELLSFLEKLGGLFEADERGRVYPASKQASSVTDLLRGYLAAKGVFVRTGFFVREVTCSEGFCLKGEGEELLCSRLVLCGGGMAQKNFGSDGNMYELAKKFGHTVIEPHPSLVQVKTDAEPIKGLKGIRADVRLSAFDGGKMLGVSEGDVIFTDYGVSGNAVFYLSPKLADRTSATLSIEFLPNVTREKLVSLLRNKIASRKDVEKSEILGCFLNNQIGRNVVRRAPAFTAEALVDTLKDYKLQYKGTLGFDYAQVTRGGVPLKETDPALQSKKKKNLYFCGELLNVDGDCGGYNLQWAFASAYCAAEGI